MKAQLYIGDDLASETVEVMQPVYEGELIIWKGERLRVRGVGHNLDKKKLQIMCHVPPKPVEEEPLIEEIEADTDELTTEDEE